MSTTLNLSKDDSHLTEKPDVIIKPLSVLFCGQKAVNCTWS